MEGTERERGRDEVFLRREREGGRERIEFQENKHIKKGVVVE